MVRTERLPPSTKPRGFYPEPVCQCRLFSKSQQPPNSISATPSCLRDGWSPDVPCGCPGEAGRARRGGIWGCARRAKEGKGAGSRRALLGDPGHNKQGLHWETEARGWGLEARCAPVGAGAAAAAPPSGTSPCVPSAPSRSFLPAAKTAWGSLPSTPLGISAGNNPAEIGSGSIVGSSVGQRGMGGQGCGCGGA